MATSRESGGRDPVCGDLLVEAGMVSVIIPAFNEERRLSRALLDIDEFLRSHRAEFEIVVVDDGSADGTADVVTCFRSENDRLRCLRLPRNQGKGAAVRTGMLDARGDILLFTDADQSTTIDQLPRLLHPLLKGGFDVAIGSRAARESRILIGQRWYRQVLARVFGALTKLLLVRGFRDCQCGFKCFRREAAREIFGRLTSPTAIFDMEALLLAARAGFRVAEVPVVWKHDPDSRLVYNVRKSIGLVRELVRLRRTWRVHWPVNVAAEPWNPDAPVASGQQTRERNDAEACFVSREQPDDVCPICRGAGVRRWRAVARVVIYRCSMCGFASIPPVFYDGRPIEWQYVENETSPADYYRLSAPHDLETFGARMERIIAHTGRAGGRVLDIGCNVGTFLEAAASSGWTAVGVESNPEAARQAREKGFEVHGGFFDERLASHLSSFDAVHLGDVLEHVFEPIDLLKRARRVLHPGGLLVVVTPDLDSVMGRRLQIKPAEHVVYFTRRSLAAAAEAAGFRAPAVERSARRRSIAAMGYSTTFSSAGRALLRLLDVPGLRPSVEEGLFRLFKDELLLTAHRPGA